jgi:hypothetical protein
VNIIISAYSYLISMHELGQLLDEKMSDEERRDLEKAEAVCRKFLAWKLQDDREAQCDVKAKLAEVLGKNAQAEDN